MRRRRRGPAYPVTTFPFLAVLLCAMGSLILLLLVLDRRAKIVARLKAQRAVKALRAEREQRATQEKALAEAEKKALAQALADRQATRERQWQSRHERFRILEENLRHRMAEVFVQSEEIRAQTKDEHKQTRLRAEKLREQKALLAEVERELASVKTEIDKSHAQNQATEKERKLMTALLLKLEKLLASQINARRRQMKTYSLVPYKGRQGDNRRPLYLEITSRGAIFHPDRLELTRWNFTAPGVRKELERRAAQSKKEHGSSPYLMMLIRPSGIENYYKLLSVLKNIKIDFGYEFLDADWLLAFDKVSTVAQPWPTSSTTSPKPPLPPLTTSQRTPFSNNKQTKTGGGPRVLQPPARFPLLPKAPTPRRSLPKQPRGYPVPPPPPPSHVVGPPPTKKQSPKSQGGTTKPSPRPRLVSNRDWVLQVECLPDVLVINPGNVRLTRAELSTLSGARQLRDAIRQRVARRQAMVRPGDPPYRPELRFLVHHGGLRTYLLAYPTLEPLNLPMRRKNVENK